MNDEEIIYAVNNLTDSIIRLLQSYGDFYFGYPYYVDEEDTNLETLSQEQDISTHPNPYISCLKAWSNSRACIPIEWIPLIIKDLGIKQ